jgi:hypothetical protein
MAVRRVVIGCLLCGAVLTPLLATPAPASWFGKLTRVSDDGARAAGRTGSHLVEEAAGYVSRLPAKLDGNATPLAAALSQEGHWTLVNRAGERITAASPTELSRALATLTPEVAGGGRVAIFLADARPLGDPRRLAELPRNAEFHLLHDRASYRLVARADGRGYDVALRPGLVLDATAPDRIGDGVHLLARPLAKSNVRIVAIEPGAAALPTSTPRLDPASGRALVDAVDPAGLPSLFQRMRGQTAVLVGRLEGAHLRVRTARGEVAVPLDAARAAAASADVSLVILRTSEPALQPGGRNAVWLRTEIKSLDGALDRATLGDFLAAFARPSQPLRASIEPVSGDRTRVTTVRTPPPSVATVAGATSRVGDLLADAASELLGKLVSEGADIEMPSRRRQIELDQRLLPWLPSVVSTGYLGLILLGAFGAPVSRRWWGRIWPLETRHEYAGAGGYHAARAVRAIAFLALFMPLVAMAAAPVQIARTAWDWLSWPLRLWRRRRASATAE